MFRTSILAALLVFLSTPLFAAGVEKRTLTSRGKERTYYLFVPSAAAASKPLPLLITLHGSGARNNGASLVAKWKAIAEESGMIVAGPDSTDPKQWISPDDGPRLLDDVVAELRKQYPIDTKRIYLFGHSGGAMFAMQIGLLESEYFAAVAIHAGALQDAAYPMTDFATRKVPFALFVGSRDPYFPVHVVERTVEHLKKNGIPAELTVIRNHTHDYHGRANEINRSAWTFLQKHTLTAGAKFTEYSNMQ